MPPVVAVALVVALIGALLLAAAAIGLRRSGAQISLARRLGGAEQVRVGDLFSGAELPPRPVRVNGRVRCADPLVTEEDERLVAFHRDVEIEVAPNRWRSIQRLRETRSFELWDHDGSITIDPAHAAEPLVSIPRVWNGSPDELDEVFQPAIARLAATHGTLRRARATTHSLSVVDRLLVLGVLKRGADAASGARPTLEPPAGGFVISNLEIEDAMRLLGGEHRRWLGLLIGGMMAGACLLLLGLFGIVIGLAVG
jgi:hypothetical protein